MMIESIFSLLPSYFPIIFLAKYKSISKSISYCFSVILYQNGVGQISGFQIKYISRTNR